MIIIYIILFLSQNFFNNAKFFFKFRLRKMPMTTEELKSKVASLIDYLQDILHEKMSCERMATFYYGSRKER